MKTYKQFSEGTIQPNGTDKIEVGCDDVASKKKTDKEMKDQQNESWTFDTAAMAKQELADAKNKAHRKRGKVANLLRKLGMKEEVEHIDEKADPTSTWVVHDGNKVKRFKTHEGAKAHATQHGGKVASSAYYADKIQGKPVKEEREQIDEVNHREYASAGKMHPTMAKHMTAGQEVDFYHSNTGDKLSGVVKHKSDKEVHIKAHKDGKMGAGEMHKFQISEELKGGQVNLDKNHNGKLDKQDFKLLRKKLKEANMPKAVNVDKVQAAGEKPHEEKWEDAKKVKKESITADQLLQALKEGMWPGTPEYNAKFGNQAKQGGGAGVKKGTRYGGSLQKPEKEDDNDADDKTAKKPKNK